MASALAKAARRLSEFMAGPIVEPRKSASPLINPRLDQLTRGASRNVNTRVRALPARQYRELAEQDDIIVAIRDRRGASLANYQPRLIIDQVVAAAKFDGDAPMMTPDRIEMALRHVVHREEADYPEIGAIDVISDAPANWPSGA